MKNKTMAIGIWSAAALLINSICTRILVNYPYGAINTSGTAAWVQEIYVSIIALIFLFIIEKLYTQFEGRDPLDIAQEAGGSAGRIIIGVMILLVLIYICPVIIREFAENMKIISLTDSPVTFITFFLIAGMVAAAYAGIEAIVRIHAIVVPIIALTYIFMMLGVLPYFDVNNLFPILGNGAEKIFVEGFFDVSLYSPLIYLFLMAPYLKTHKNMKISVYTGFFISAFLLISNVFVYLGSYPYPSSAEIYTPTYQLARMIYYGRFFQRVEAIFFVSWVVAILLYASVLLYFITHIFTKTFRLQYRKPVVIPFTAAVFVLSLIPSNQMENLNLGTKYYSYFSWIVVFPMIIMLLLIAHMLRKRSRKEGNSE